MDQPLKAASLISISFLCSCGAVPSHVTYSSGPTGSSDSDSYVFRQKRSLLLLQNDNNNKLNVTVSPSELDSNGDYTPLYTIKGVDNFRSTTQITATYLDNTKLLDQLSFTTSDNLVDTINKIGDVAKAAIPLVATMVSGTAQPVAPTFTPTAIDPAQAISKGWQADRLNPGYCVRLRDASIESEETMTQFISDQSARGSFPAPACVSATLDLAKIASNSTCSDQSVGSNQITSVHVTYAHESNVVPVPLPSTGAVKMGTICGASVTVADKQDRTNVLTVLQTALQQAANAKAAWNAAKGGDKNVEPAAK